MTELRPLQPPDEVLEVKTCKYCLKGFKTPDSEENHCSDDCYYLDKKCPWCGSDAIFWDHIGNMYCMKCSFPFNKMD
jgi:hypothetical protein